MVDKHDDADYLVSVNFRHHLAEAAIRSVSSRLATANDETSPSAAFITSFTMHWVRVRLLLTVALVAPVVRFLTATSTLREGETSAALGCELAPKRILVMPSHGAESVSYTHLTLPTKRIV